MTNCKHEWELYKSRLGNIEIDHKCSKCGKLGHEVKRFDRKTMSDKYVVRAISRK